jgi:hypothetical protein
MHVLVLEGKPLDAGQVAMFEMCDREGWSSAQRLEVAAQRPGVE